MKRVHVEEISYTRWLSVLTVPVLYLWAFSASIQVGPSSDGFAAHESDIGVMLHSFYMHRMLIELLMLDLQVKFKTDAASRISVNECRYCLSLVTR